MSAGVRLSAPPPACPSARSWAGGGRCTAPAPACPSARKAGRRSRFVGAPRDRVREYRLSIVDAAEVIAHLTAATVSPADGKAAANHNDASRRVGVPLE